MVYDSLVVVLVHMVLVRGDDRPEHIRCGPQCKQLFSQPSALPIRGTLRDYRSEPCRIGGDKLASWVEPIYLVQPYTHITDVACVDDFYAMPCLPYRPAS